MEKVIRAVGALLLVAVVVLSVLTYAGIFNLSSGIEYIKNGISRLVTWFIPQKFEVAVSVLVNGTYEPDTRVIRVNQNVAANTKIATIDVYLKGAPVEIVLTSSAAGVVVNIGGISNATVVPTLPQAVPTAGGLVINIYSSGEGHVQLVLIADQDIVAPFEIGLFYRQA